MRKDLVEKIKKQLKSLFTQKFAQVKAGDIVITSPDEVLAVGSEVFMLDMEGNNVPLADGEYILDSGDKIAVVGGKIEAMVAAEVEVEVETETEMEEKPMVEEEKEVKEEVKVEQACPLTEKVEKMEAEIAELKKMFAEMTAEKEQMKQEFSKIAELPSTKSIEVKPSEFKSVEEKKTSASNIDLGTIIANAKKKVRG